MFNGMCSGYIDPERWATPPVISVFSQGETLWLEVPKTEQSLRFAKDACLQSVTDRSNKNFRLSDLIIDPAKLVKLSTNKDLLFDFYSHKKPVPVQQLNELPIEAISESSRININRKPIQDVGQIQQGTFTVGPGADNHYPTFGGAGGGFAALGNLTANLSFVLTGIVFETAMIDTSISLNNHVLSVMPSTYGFVFDPLIHIVSDAPANLFYPKPDGPGNVVFSNLSIRTTAPVTSFIRTIVTFNDFLTAVTHCYLDGTNGCSIMILLESTGPNLIRRNLIYNGWSEGIRLGQDNNTIQNNTIVDIPEGLTLNNHTAIIRNNYVADCFVGCISGKANTTGLSNATSDATGQGGWSVDIGNQINKTSASSISLLPESYGDIIRGGPLAGAGANTAILSPCIKGRISPAPGTALPSIGAAELSISPRSDMRYW